MDDIRKTHNDIKRDLIQKTCSAEMRVLDVGCGYGGDLPKWRLCNPGSIDLCDPSYSSIQEAEQRARNLKMFYNLRFIVGDIRACPKTVYDVICYNFSIQYIFAHKSLFFNSINEIVRRSRSGTRLIGCVPDSNKILEYTPFRDDIGNYITRCDDTTGMGGWGEMIDVFLMDTPFYNSGSRPEPLAYKDLLITHLENQGYMLESWDDFDSPHDISRMYSSFIFVYK